MVKLPKSGALAALSVTLLISGAPAQEKIGGPEVIAQGKKLFEKSCFFCHSLALPLAKNKERQGWTETVKKMVHYGAPLNSGQREAVVSYLTAKSIFETSCDACHSSFKVLSKSGPKKDWEATVERMAAHVRELIDKGQQTRQLSNVEIEGIAAYLSTVVPTE